jgi:hypothetical protein
MGLGVPTTSASFLGVVSGPWGVFVSIAGVKTRLL